MARTRKPALHCLFGDFFVCIFSAVIFFACVLPPPPAQALGIVSRSCGPLGAQESVTVDWHFRPHYLKTFSIHYRNGVFLHTASSMDDNGAQWQLGWRSYAGHFGSEFWYGRVIGQHYAYRSGVIAYLGMSNASDCNLREWG